MIDPFANIVDQAAASAEETRASLLDSVKRGYAPVRKIFVQQPREATERPSLLGKLVQRRAETALRLFLLTLALEPLKGFALPAIRWAEMISTPAKPCTQSQLTRTIEVLKELKLLDRQGSSRKITLMPLTEDGLGDAYERPQEAGKVGKGFFIIPHQFWTDGLVDQLRLPGLAMFLVSLHDTHQDPSFQVSLEKMAEWYGISERTAERGYNELRKQNVLLTRVQQIQDPAMPNGVRPVTWRALATPYSTHARQALQDKTRHRVRAQAETTS